MSNNGLNGVTETLFFKDGKSMVESLNCNAILQLFKYINYWQLTTANYICHKKNTSVVVNELRNWMFKKKKV